MIDLASSGDAEEILEWRTVTSTQKITQGY